MKSTCSRITLILAGVLLVMGLILLPNPVAAQNCGCMPTECCSAYGYCGTGEDYCGAGCRLGPCHVGVFIGFYYVEEINGASKNYCDKSRLDYPRCNPGKKYYGRGPPQLSYNYNYGPAGRSVGFDGIKNPEIVATNSEFSFKASIWYWITNVHHGLSIGNGFGATIRAINRQQECDGANPDAVHACIGYYRDYCNRLNVPTGDNLGC